MQNDLYEDYALVKSERDAALVRVRELTALVDRLQHKVEVLIHALQSDNEC